MIPRSLCLCLLIVALSCEDEEETDLSGEWIFTEYPAPSVRRNRLRSDVPAFDVIFRISGNSITEVDLLLNDVRVDGETADFDGRNINITYPGFYLEIIGVSNLAGFMKTETINYQVPGKDPETYNGFVIYRLNNN